MNSMRIGKMILTFLTFFAILTSTPVLPIRRPSAPLKPRRWTSIQRPGQSWRPCLESGQSMLRNHYWSAV
jgi:hypothetical protein